PARAWGFKSPLRHALVVGLVAESLEQREVCRGLSVAAAELFFAVSGDHGRRGLDERGRSLTGELDERAVPVLVAVPVVGVEREELGRAAAGVRYCFFDQGAATC